MGKLTAVRMVSAITASARHGSMRKDIRITRPSALNITGTRERRGSGIGGHLRRGQLLAVHEASRLELVHLVVPATQRHQLVVGALLADAPTVDHTDPIGVADAAEAVGDE